MVAEGLTLDTRAANRMDNAHFLGWEQITIIVLDTRICAGILGRAIHQKSLSHVETFQDGLQI